MSRVNHYQSSFNSQKEKTKYIGRNAWNLKKCLPLRIYYDRPPSLKASVGANKNELLNLLSPMSNLKASLHLSQKIVPKVKLWKDMKRKRNENGGKNTGDPKCGEAWKYDLQYLSNDANVIFILFILMSIGNV